MLKCRCVVDKKKIFRYLFLWQDLKGKILIKAKKIKVKQDSSSSDSSSSDDESKAESKPKARKVSVCIFATCFVQILGV